MAAWKSIASSLFVALMALGQTRSYLPNGNMEQARQEQAERWTEAIPPNPDDSLHTAIVRLRKNRAELRALLDADSVLWVKSSASKDPESTQEDRERERRIRKRKMLESFCRGNRLASAAEVDSLGLLTPAERTACKDYLNAPATKLP